jgi:CheY-like chemotaxis protein
MDFAEFFTHSARELVPLAWKKGLLFLFDFRGPFVFVETDLRPLRAALQRMSLAALDLLNDGFIFVAAQTEMHENGTADLSISIAGTGDRASDAQISEVLRRLDLHERPHLPDDVEAAEGARVAVGNCPITGATLSFAANRSDGLLFAFDLSVPARLTEAATPQPDAEGARAWLISETPAVYQSLVRRLQRLGWATSTFTSVQRAADQLAAMTPGMARPSLVIGAQSRHVTAEQLGVLRGLMSPDAQIVLAAAIDSRARSGGAGIELHHWPFSPAELHEFTRRLRGGAAVYSGETMPAPMSFADRPRALVVDDNAVNLLVASGLLQMAGFEVETVASGVEAVAACRKRVPQLVLMDVHMPGMDGLAATRAMRELQRQGLLPQFAIVGATADAMAIGERACYEAGMDGYLSKPLSLEAIQGELRRVLPQLSRSLAAH